MSNWYSKKQKEAHALWQKAVEEGNIKDEKKYEQEYLNYFRAASKVK